MMYHMFKRSILFLLTILVLMAVPATAVPAHAEGKIKATKVSLNKRKIKISIGKKEKITITMNKKNTKNVRVIIKSSNRSIVQAPSKVVLKKGKLSANFKITARKMGTAAIKVYFKKDDGSYSNKATLKVTVAPIKLTGVTLNNQAPKIGDKLTANIKPSNATGVTYRWYTGDSAVVITREISGATSSYLYITKSMAGKYIKVFATGKDGRATAATKVPVPIPSGVYSAQIGTPEPADISFDGDILIPLTLYDYSNNPISSLKLATDSSVGVKILNPASDSGAEIVDKNNALYIKVNGAYCIGMSEPLDVKIKLLTTGTIVEESINLEGQAGIYDIVGYNNTYSESASTYTINLKNVSIEDTRGKKLTGSDPGFWNYFTNTSDEENEWKYRITATIPASSKASFSKDKELKDVALDSTGTENTILYNPVPMEESITITLHLQKANGHGGWEDLYNAGWIQYDVTFPNH